MKARPAFSEACGDPAVSSAPSTQIVPSIRDGHASKATDERRLAGSVRADEAVNLAGRDINVDVRERRLAGELLAEPSDLYPGAGSSSQPRSPQPQLPIQPAQRPFGWSARNLSTLSLVTTTPGISIVFGLPGFPGLDRIRGSPGKPPFPPGRQVATRLRSGRRP